MYKTSRGTHQGLTGNDGVGIKGVYMPHIGTVLCIMQARFGNVNKKRFYRDYECAESLPTENHDSIVLAGLPPAEVPKLSRIPVWLLVA